MEPNERPVITQALDRAKALHKVTLRGDGLLESVVIDGLTIPATRVQLDWKQGGVPVLKVTLAPLALDADLEALLAVDREHDGDLPLTPVKERDVLTRISGKR